MKQTPKSVNEFSEYLRVVKGRSEKTVFQYRQDLLTFFRYLRATDLNIDPEKTNISEIDVEDIDIDYIRKIDREKVMKFLFYTANGRKNNASTRARKLSALKSYFKYLCVIKRDLEDNPALEIDAPKKKSALPKYLSVEESLDLLNAVLTDELSKHRQRDYCILTLFLNCGMRLSELVGINLSDLDKELRSLRVLGKGNKERIIYLNDACREAISAYLPHRAADGEPKDKNALFISRNHNRVSNQIVQKIVEKYLKAAGLENKHFSTHKLRHTAATLIYQSGKVDVRVLKDILGHEQLNTTQIYTHISDKYMEDDMAKNPLAKKKI